jgi:hypothetical protein
MDLLEIDERNEAGCKITLLLERRDEINQGNHLTPSIIMKMIQIYQLKYLYDMPLRQIQWEK